MTLIPWGDGTAAPPVIVGVGDSIAFSAYVKGRAQGSGFFVDCRLYDSQTAPERFEFSVSDTSVAAIELGVAENYIVAKSAGSAVLTAASSGVANVELQIHVLSALTVLRRWTGAGALAARERTAHDHAVAASARCARS